MLPRRIRYTENFDYAYLNFLHEAAASNQAATSSQVEEGEAPPPDPEREWSQFDWN